LASVQNSTRGTDFQIFFHGKEFKRFSSVDHVRKKQQIISAA
jgi:hypothetical protein